MPTIIPITDYEAPELDVFARLNEREICPRDQRDDGLFIAESPNVIHRALDAGFTPVSLLMEGRHIEGQAREIVARCGDIPLYTAPLEVLTQLTGFKLTRGVLCAMRRKPERTMEEVCAGARRIAVLEDIQNPTNLGAVFRSAAALGMEGVLLTPACTDPLYRRCVRVSMGTVFQVPWARVHQEMDQWPGPGMERLRDLGFRTVAMALREDAISIDDPVLMNTEKLAIVLGTEGDGLAGDTIARCDWTAMIPMSNGVDSLNVAAASAVAFWQLGRTFETGTTGGSAFRP